MPERRKDPKQASSGTGAISWAAARQRLVDRRDELLERVRAVEKDLERQTDPTSADWNERASQRSNDEVLAAIGEAGERELGAINLALRRIELGTYGTCTRCGKPIGKARLQALPHVDSCGACAD